MTWDEDTSPPPAAAFRHVLRVGGTKQALGPAEHVDVSVTHWAGQYVDRRAWPWTAWTGCTWSGPVSTRARCHRSWTPYTGGLHDGFRQDAMYARR